MGLKDVLRGLVGRRLHIHMIRSNESLFGELREVSDQVAVVVWEEHTYYICLDKIVWFQEWPGDAGATGPFRSEFH